jgi:hypothetical protein
MSDEPHPVEMSAEEIRLRERRSFDAFNEAQAKRREKSRNASNLAVTEENRRWVRPADQAGPNNDAAQVESQGENDTPGT